MPDAIVLPMLPKATYWKINTITLFFYCLFTRQKGVMARNVIATNMALQLRKWGVIKKVCFDARGAIAAEWKEYELQVPEQWKKAIDAMEEQAVMQADFRLAVTNELVNYWARNYKYNSKLHVVIPCTINSAFVLKSNSAEAIQNKKSELELNENDIVFAYSGSTAGWQSFQTLELFITPLLSADKHFKLIFLAQQEKSIDSLKEKFPQQVLQKWVPHNEVTAILAACDYGILIRENTVTNQVASPTKFAEYLASGLPVIISPNLGDYSAFVETHHCGIKFNGEMPVIGKPDSATKTSMKQLALQNFTKESYRENYKYLLQQME